MGQGTAEQKPRATITAAEWNRMSADYKTVREDWTRMVLRDCGGEGTCLVPVEVVG